MKIPVYNTEGKEIEQLEVSDAIFAVPVKEHVVAEVSHAQRANARIVRAHVKERGHVRGGGRKPWRQKGTGRARAGSIRSPLWKGGGVTFGPLKDRNFGLKVNKKVKQSALRMMLSDKASSGTLVVVDRLPTDAKTKSVVALRTALPGSGRKMLIALPKKNEEFLRALSNVPKTDSIAAAHVNVLDMLNHQYLLTTKDGIKVLEKTFV